MDERISTGDDDAQCLAENNASTDYRLESRAPAAPAKAGVKGLDLFAGAGGFSLGAIGAGIDIVGALEFHKHAAATYEANIKRKGDAKVTVIKEDILAVSCGRYLDTFERRDDEWRIFRRVVVLDIRRQQSLGAASLGPSTRAESFGRRGSADLSYAHFDSGSDLS